MCTEFFALALYFFSFLCVSVNGTLYEDEEWDEAGEGMMDNGEIGIPVKALYDYEGVETDELSFTAGKCFFRLNLSLFSLYYIHLSL